MFKIEKFNINLDRKNAIFRTGETIMGSLDFSIKREMYTRSIRMKIEGFSIFETIESDGNKGLKVVDGFEPYLNFFINFLPVDSQSAILLNPGDYSYRFEIKLPDNLPSSIVHGSLGETSYRLSATIDVPWSTNKTIVKPFYVLSVVDLNSHENEGYKVSMNSKIDKIYGCLCCKSRPLMITLTTLNRSSYLPCEDVLFKVDLINLSSRQLTSMRVELVRKVFYKLATTSAKKKKEFLRSLAKIEYKFDADPGKQFTWPDGKLTIPDSLTPTHDDTKMFIQITYDLKLTVFSTFFTTRATLNLPIRIGNVRLPAPNYTDAINSNEAPNYDVSTMDENALNNIIKLT